MITELLSERYKGLEFTIWWGSDKKSEEKLFNQVYSILHQDMFFFSNEIYLESNIYYYAEIKLSREMGWEKIPSTKRSPQERCKEYILNNNHDWLDRLSLVELLIREFETNHYSCINLSSFSSTYPSQMKTKFSSHITAEEWDEKLKKKYNEVIKEINYRLQKLDIKLFYTNGYFLPTNDNLTCKLIEEPFWDLLQNRRELKNIENEMLEAIEYYIQGKYNNSCKNAFMAFESCLKIKIPNNDRSTFATLIDNKSLDIIEGSERQYLKDLNAKFRNTHSHGAGSQIRQNNTKSEATFVLSICMTYIKHILSGKS